MLAILRPHATSHASIQAIEPVANKHLVRPKTLTRLLIFNAVIFGVSLCILGFSTVIYNRAHLMSEREVLHRSSFYCKPVPALTLQALWLMFGSLAPPIDTMTPGWKLEESITHPISSNLSIFRQDPSRAVDAAWARVADLGVLPLTRAQVSNLGKDPADVVQASPSWGFGDDMFVGQFDGLHLLHCLNSMRKSLAHNYPFYYAEGEPKFYRVHLSHCQEALARHLMCQPSLELFTFNWVEGHEAPFPDFDMTHKCIDFEALKAWQDEHRVKNITSKMWGELKRPEGYKPLPPPILWTEWNDPVWDIPIGYDRGS